METPNERWINSASKHIVDFECDCDCFRCMHDEHHDNCNPEYFSGGEIPHLPDYDLARDIERGK